MKANPDPRALGAPVTLFPESELPPATPRILSLVERFGVPPFSVFDARQGYWQERKSDWIALGIQSELGRDAPAYNIVQAGTSNTSVFDPVLTECVYRWFVAPGGWVLDPFAGGSVRGIVAGVLGRNYTGVDLSARQVAANEAQYAAMAPWVTKTPRWITGDSRDVLGRGPAVPAIPPTDLVFTCPPYYDLEVYSTDPRDLSAMPSYGEFAEAYGDIMGNAVRHMRADSFAVVVVGNVRDRRGILHDIVGDTIDVMRLAGADYYNEGVLLTSVGTASVRAFQFAIGRKLVRTHQSVLVFVKGDPRRAADRAGTLTTKDAAVIDVPGDTTIVYRCSDGPAHVPGCNGTCGSRDVTDGAQPL